MRVRRGRLRASDTQLSVRLTNLQASFFAPPPRPVAGLLPNGKISPEVVCIDFSYSSASPDRRPGTYGRQAKLSDTLPARPMDTNP
eukprot:scaffold32885_cov71-Phaeocystis_antarctica.AAC.1